MIANKILKGIGIGVGGLLGTILAIIALVLVWIGLALVVAVPLGWFLMLIVGVVHSFTAVPALGYITVWLLTTAVLMLFGV